MLTHVGPVLADSISYEPCFFIQTAVLSWCPPAPLVLSAFYSTGFPKL